jgi:hypothetical protein
MPKLFLSAENDQWTDDMLALYDKVPDPKEKHVYPGDVHGTMLFTTDHGPDLTQRLLTFIKTHAPAK